MVGDGAAAVQRAQEWRPNLLIVDLLMPRLDGYDVIRELKSRPETRGIPVLMLTGLRSDQVGNMPHTHEPDWFMTKPFELDQLENTVAQLMARGAVARN
jgi:CheY-like chemotaxis protein